MMAQLPYETALVTILDTVVETFWGVAPQNQALPFVQCSLVVTTGFRHSLGPDPLHQTTVQVDCYCASPDDRAVKRREIEDTLLAVEGPVTVGADTLDIKSITFVSGRETHETNKDDLIYRSSQDFQITWNQE